MTNWNEDNLNLLLRINWRVSMVLVVVVIPAPIGNANFVAVKTLVVGFFIFYFKKKFNCLIEFESFKKKNKILKFLNKIYSSI